MSEKQKIPKLRFGQFNDEWEQPKLGDIAHKITQKNIEHQYSETFTNSAKLGIISQRDYFDHDVVNENNIDGYYVVENEDFVYNPRISSSAPVGPINRNKLGRTGVVSPLYTVFKTQNVDNTYLEQFFKSNFWHEFMRFNGDSGARSDRFSIKDAVFFQMPVPLPSDIDEQIKIGDFLKNIDDLIWWQKNKLVKLKNMRQSCLQKMFPKEGEDVPEIRFSEFSGPWNRTKLEEYIMVSKQKNVMNYYKKEDVLSVSGDFGIVNQIEFQGRSFAGASVSNYGVVETGDIVYTKSPLKANPYGIIKANLGTPGIVSTLYAVYKPKETVDPLFVQTYFNLDSRMNKYMRPLVNKGAKNDMKVSAENALKGYVCFPELDEQIKIAKFLTEIDEMLLCYEKELQMLKRIKQGCLQKMFV